MQIAEVNIRKANREDVPSLLALVQELAEYEHCPDEVEVSVEEMEEAGFGPGKVFDAFVADAEGVVVGMAIFYTGYSTWKGKTLYLEDFLVTQAWRRKGVGKLLFDAVIQEAKNRKVRRMDWQVLDWNEPAIEFYKGYDSLLDPEWINGRLKFEVK
jgi:GNAT superfamily N-acetyltransferase